MTKDRLVDDLIVANNELTTAVHKLDRTVLLSKAFGEWSIKDVVAHIAGWQRLNTDMLLRMSRGQPPVPDGMDFDDNAMNAEFASAAREKSPVEVIADYITAYNNLIQAAEALPEERFSAGRFATRVLQGNGIDHVREHLTEIRIFLASKP